MAWTEFPIIDKTDTKYGVVAYVPTETASINLWQDITNPPAPFEIDDLREGLAPLAPGFYNASELHLMAEVISNEPEPEKDAE